LDLSAILELFNIKLLFSLSYWYVNILLVFSFIISLSYNYSCLINEDNSILDIFLFLYICNKVLFLLAVSSFLILFNSLAVDIFVAIEPIVLISCLSNSFLKSIPFNSGSKNVELNLLFVNKLFVE